MKSFSTGCPSLQFLPHQQTPNTWVSSPPRWAWLTEVWPLAHPDPIGTYFYILQGEMRPREAKGLRDKEKTRLALSVPKTPYLLSPHP